MDLSNHQPWCGAAITGLLLAGRVVNLEIQPCNCVPDLQ